MANTGPKVGWLVGGAGGLVWLPILGIVWLVNGLTLPGVAMPAIFVPVFTLRGRTWTDLHEPAPPE